MIKFNSSVITSISEVMNDKVTIGFNGKEYTYQVSDTEGWENDLNDVIEEGESVGAFVNRAIRSELLQQI
jgi:hypothetical protein